MTYQVGGAVYPQCLGALPVADPPAEDVLRTGHHFCSGDLELHDPSRVGLHPVLEGWVGPVLERLDEVAAEANGHRGTKQPVRLKLLQVDQQGLQLRVRDWSLPRSFLELRRGLSR
jgi:hypothetical protein